MNYFQRSHNFGTCFLALLLGVVVTSCSPTSKKYAANRATEIGEIFFKGTDSYTEKEKQLKLTYEEASKAYRNWHKKTYGEDRLAVGRHSIIVGDFYVISINSRMKAPGISLFGYYVNGNTGQVSLKGRSNEFVRRKDGSYKIVVEPRIIVEPK